MSEAVICHFRGGPLDGMTRAMSDARPHWYFPRPPAWSPATAIAYLEDRELLELPEPWVYERLPGVVSSEAVYQWIAA